MATVPELEAASLWERGRSSDGLELWDAAAEYLVKLAAAVFAAAAAAADDDGDDDDDAVELDPPPP